MPKKLTKQTSLGLALPPRRGAEEPVASPAAKPSEKLKKIPVNRMRQRIRKLPPTHYTLYRSAVSLLEYTYRLIEKFPKSEKLALARISNRSSLSRFCSKSSMIWHNRRLLRSRRSM